MSHSLIVLIREFDASVNPIYQDDYINATLVSLDEWVIMVHVQSQLSVLFHNCVSYASTFIHLLLGYILYKVREHRHMALQVVYAPVRFKIMEHNPIPFILDHDILYR